MWVGIERRNGGTAAEKELGFGDVREGGVFLGVGLAYGERGSL